MAVVHCPNCNHAFDPNRPIPEHDVRIDDPPGEMVASCSCGWRRVTRHGRKAPIPMSQDRAYSVAVALTNEHLRQTTEDELAPLRASSIPH